ncbi:MAG: VCBS repeat-containing protein [Nitrospirae bacterium]|nr:VCBS repeat-containing protein [Nitrospirota bacterium]
MRKIYIAIFTIFLSFNTGIWASGDVSQSAEPDNPVIRARDLVLSYFTPINGTVENVTDGLVSVRFEGKVNIKKGLRFSIYRKGTPFYHPVTNELIGNTETFIGRIEIKEINEPDGLYICTVIKGEVKAGDIARITTSKIKLAFFQERKSDWTLSEAFYSSIKDSERFEILESYAPAYKPEDLSQIARDINAEVVLLFSTPVKDEKRVLNIKLYWAEDAKLFSESEEAVSSDVVSMTAPGEEFISASLANKEPWGSYKLAGGQIFAMGDVDGNGADELIVSDGNNISIYNFKEELQESWSIKGSPQERHLSIDVLDVNNNGRAEIFVTYMTDERGIKTGDSGMAGIKDDNSAIKSFVLEYDPAEGYRKIKDKMPYFLRVSGKILLMQKFDTGRIFSGAVYEGEWKDGNYQPKRQLALPPDVNIYGFTFVDWQNKGMNHLVTFDDNGYLILYDSQVHAIWKSSRTYGKFKLSVEKGTYSVANPVAKKFLRGRLISVKTGRGEEIIVVNKIPVAERVPGLGTSGAEIYSLWWDSGVMDEKLILSKIPGDLTDYWIEGNKLFFIAKGNLLSFIKNAVTGELLKGSVLYYYNLTDK